MLKLTFIIYILGVVVSILTLLFISKKAEGTFGLGDLVVSLFSWIVPFLIFLFLIAEVMSGVVFWDFSNRK